MADASSEKPFAAPESRRGASPKTHGHSVRFLLPSPVSAGHALSILIVGFVLEATTEVYQFLARGNLVQGPLVYYTTLATTILGFYLMFLGLREWHEFHPKPAPMKPAPPKRPWPWFRLLLWAGGTAMTAVLSLALMGRGTGSAPYWVAWPIGGLVVLAFGSFFFGLRKEARLHGSSWSNVFGWAAFTWSLGVATVAGLVVGDHALQLLSEFVTNWVALVASVGPIVVAMSPLFVTYALMTGAFWPVLRRQRSGIP
ncbi:MAG: hypothetical protein WB778_00375 [Thermoplasmata archaeon]